MHPDSTILALLQYFLSFTFGVFAANSSTADFANACYNSTLPSTTPSTANRTIPWGTPSFTYSNGSTCCSSLAQVRVRIDEIDVKLLRLLSQRAAYVREATRFESTYDTVDNPIRDAQVVDGAVEEAPSVGLPQTIAAAVFEAIINSSVFFEQCVFNEFDLIGALY